MSSSARTDITFELLEATAVASADRGAASVRPVRPRVIVIAHRGETGL
jgi:hypothetical protein